MFSHENTACHAGFARGQTSSLIRSALCMSLPFLSRPRRSLPTIRPNLSGLVCTAAVIAWLARIALCCSATVPTNFGCFYTERALLVEIAAKKTTHRNRKGRVSRTPTLTHTEQGLFPASTPDADWDCRCTHNTRSPNHSRVALAHSPTALGTPWYKGVHTSGETWRGRYSIPPVFFCSRVPHPKSLPKKQRQPNTKQTRVSEKAGLQRRPPTWSLTFFLCAFPPYQPDTPDRHGTAVFFSASRVVCVHACNAHADSRLHTEMVLQESDLCTVGRCRTYIGSFRKLVHNQRGGNNGGDVASVVYIEIALGLAV